MKQIKYLATTGDTILTTSSRTLEFGAPTVPSTISNITINDVSYVPYSYPTSICIQNGYIFTLDYFAKIINIFITSLG